MSQELSRVTIRIPVEWRDALRDEALRKEQTITTFLGDALFKALPKEVRETLPAREWKPVGRPAK